MIQARPDRCTGCGECLAVCPTGALRLLEGHVVVEHALCRQCEACIPACQQGALVVVEAPLALVEPCAGGNQAAAGQSAARSPALRRVGCWSGGAGTARGRRRRRQTSTPKGSAPVLSEAQSPDAVVSPGEKYGCRLKRPRDPAARPRTACGACRGVLCQFRQSWRR